MPFKKLYVPQTVPMSRTSRSQNDVIMAAMQCGRVHLAVLNNIPVTLFACDEEKPETIR